MEGEIEAGIYQYCEDCGIEYDALSEEERDLFVAGYCCALSKERQTRFRI
jgi:hypothetical protein